MARSAVQKNSYKYSAEEALNSVYNNYCGFISHCKHMLGT